MRDRLMAGYENKSSFIWRDGFDKKFPMAYASTTLSAGYEFTQVDIDSTMWGGIPRWYRDSSQIFLPLQPDQQFLCAGQSE